MMNQQIDKVLGQFFVATKKLNELDIIRSRDYIGDIARYLCCLMYDMEPGKRGLTVDYDGTIGSSRVKVAVNNCPQGTPVILDEPFEFDELIVILAPNSKLRPQGIGSHFIFYRFNQDEVRQGFQPRQFKSTGTKYVGLRKLFSRKYDKVLDLTEPILSQGT